MICRRLAEAELKEWLELSNDGVELPKETLDGIYKLAKLDETIIYVASINDQFIGGTWLWRDASRLSMVLAKAWIKSEYSTVASNQLLKSSLPWFKSLAIREVDALVYTTQPDHRFSFHLNPILNHWTYDPLTAIGFEEIKSYYQVVLRRAKGRDSSFQFVIQNQSNIEWFGSVLRKYSNDIGLELSHASLILEYGARNNTLFSYTMNGDTILTTTLAKVDEYTTVGPLVYDPQILSSQQAIDAILTTELDTPFFLFSLLNNEQLEYLKSLNLDQYPFESEMRLLTRLY
jgi:hypothetical protein